MRRGVTGRGGAGCDYCALDPANTYCLYSGAGAGPGCGSLLTRGVDNRERALLLDLHNSYRSRVCYILNSGTMVQIICTHAIVVIGY